MADLGENFDVSSLPEGKDFDALPAGEYPVVIVASEVKANSAGTGRYLKLEMQIVSGPHINRKLWDNLNIWHPKQETVQIAKASLKSIAQAVGVLNVKDSTQLHNKPLIAKVKIKEDETYGRSNQVSGYKPIPAATAPQPAPSQEAAMSHPSTGAAVPW